MSIARKFPPARQSGVALAVGLIFLVIITLVGLAAMRVTTSQTLQAANYQFKTITFQGSEGGIRTIMGEITGVLPPPDPTKNLLVQAINATSADPDNSAGPPRRVPQFSESGSGRQVNTQAILTSDNPDGGGAPLANFSLGGQVAEYRFSIRSESTIPNTAARSDHQQGVRRLGPKP